MFFFAGRGLLAGGGSLGFWPEGGFDQWGGGGSGQRGIFCQRRVLAGGGFSPVPKCIYLLKT